MQPELLVLGGGIGKRLEGLTGCSIAKCALPISDSLTGIDLLKRQLSTLGPVTFSVQHYFDWYLRNSGGNRVEHQAETGIAQTLIEKDHPVVIIPNDCVIDLSFIPGMIESHKSGTITWAVTTWQHPQMLEYTGSTIVGGAIVGREATSVMRTPVMLIEPDILKSFIQPGEDFYWKTIRRIEDENATRMQRGEPSILNAFITSTPCFDYGTPARLETLRKELHEITNL